MRVVAYLRVSTQQQAENGLGLDVQRAHIEAWAERLGHQVVAWESDEGLSGSNGLESRVGLYKALLKVEDKSVDGIVVYRLDRLARDLILQETLLGQVWKHDGAVYSTIDAESETLDPTSGDPTRTLHRQIMGAISQYERALIVMRLRSGKLAKQVRGGYIGGQVPFGYDLDGAGNLQVSEPEQEVLLIMHALRSDGHSYRSICERLEADGHKAKGSWSWQPATVRRLLIRTGRPTEVPS